MKWTSQRITLVLLTVLLGASLVYTFSQYRQANTARLQIEAQRQKSVFSLLSYVENMEGSLSKTRASSTTGQQVMFLSSCWANSQLAQDNLSEIGMNNIDLSGLQRFVAQTGDYCMYLAQKLARGDTVTGQEWEELQRLESSVKDLSRGLSETGMNIAVTGARFSVSHLVAGNPTEDSLFRGFSEIDNLIQSVPSPAYDGPFSDRSLERKPLSNPGEEISGDTAKEIALDFLWDVEDVDSIRVELAGGTIPYHMVTAKRSDGTEATAAVAVQGGFVLWATDQRNPGIPRIDVENARQSAVRFLAEKGFSALIETGWRKSGPGGDRVVFNYAKVKSVNFGGADTPVIMYPDLVKVEVGLDNGQVVAFDQVPLLTNSGGRPGIRPPMISSSQAYRTLKEGLKAEGEPRLAVIPMTGQREVMAWEFKVISNQDLYLIYVNAMTGQEEMVLQVINDESGSLTS